MVTRLLGNRLGIVWIDTEEPVGFSTSASDRTLPATDTIAPSGLVLGRGLLMDFPIIRLPTGGTAERFDLTFSPTNPIITSWVDTPGLIEGVQIYRGFVCLDTRYRIDGSVRWLQSAYVNVAEFDDTGQSDVVTLKCSTEFMDRSRANLTVWSDAGHRRQHPTDAFFKEVGLNGITKTFVF